MPAGPGPDGPTGEAPPSVGGGGGLPFIIVPDVIGLTLAKAEAEIIGAGATVGGVTIVSEAGSLGDMIIRPARAQDACGADKTKCECIAQSEVGECFLPCIVLLTVTPFAAPIPEPPSLALFAMGLGLLIVITVWRRRRS